MSLNKHEPLIQSPEEIVEQCTKKYNIKKYVGLFSGGVDSLSVSHYVSSKLKILDEVLYLKTNIGTTENFEFVIDICNRFGWKLHVYEPKPRFSYESFVRKYGFPHRGLHGGMMSWLKWFQVRQFAKDHNAKKEGIAFVSGRRKKESKQRKKMKSFTPYERPEPNIITCSPIYYWTEQDVQNYMKEHQLEKCPVYYTLHMSGDCLCGCYSEIGETELIKTFHPDLAKKILDLERKYGGKWGSQVSMTGAIKQQKISEFVCSECIYDSNK